MGFFSKLFGGLPSWSDSELLAERERKSKEFDAATTPHHGRQVSTGVALRISEIVTRLREVETELKRRGVGF